MCATWFPWLVVSHVSHSVYCMRKHELELTTGQGEKAGGHQSEAILWMTKDTLPPRPSLFNTSTLAVRFYTKRFNLPGFRLLYTFHKVSCSECIG